MIEPLPIGAKQVISKGNLTYRQCHAFMHEDGVRVIYLSRDKVRWVLMLVMRSTTPPAEQA